jgi:hypothetical protein
MMRAGRIAKIGPAAGGPPQYDPMLMTSYVYNGQGQRVKGKYSTEAK